MSEDRVATCKSCGAEIIWAAVVKKDGSPGKMPFDPEPRADGTHQLFRKPDGTGVRAEWVPSMQREGKALRCSHFATCPNADQHRKG